VFLFKTSIIPREPSKASIGSGRAACRGFKRWLGPDVSPASIYLEDARFIFGCPCT
jgi:hypothetical protein